MRRILFNEEQKRIIKESLLQQAAMTNLPSHLSRDIQSNNTSERQTQYRVRRYIHRQA